MIRKPNDPHGMSLYNMESFDRIAIALERIAYSLSASQAVTAPAQSVTPEKIEVVKEETVTDKEAYNIEAVEEYIKGPWYIKNRPFNYKEWYIEVMIGKMPSAYFIPHFEKFKASNPHIKKDVISDDEFEKAFKAFKQEQEDITQIKKDSVLVTNTKILENKPKKKLGRPKSKVITVVRETDVGLTKRTRTKNK